MNVEEMRAVLQEQVDVPHVTHAIRMAGVNARVGDLRRTRLRVSAVCVAAAAAFVVAAAVTVVLPSRLNRVEPASVPLTLSVLQHHQALRPLDAEIAAGAGGGQVLVHPGQGSLAQTAFESRFYLLETTGGQVCLMITDADEDGTGGTQCQPRSSLLDPGFFDITRGGTTSMDPIFAVVVAPDAYTEAETGGTTVAVTNNVAVLELKAPQEQLELTGPGVQPVILAIGDDARRMFSDPDFLRTRRTP